MSTQYFRRSLTIFLALHFYHCKPDVNLTFSSFQSDRFLQETASAVDVLWVIDNSESMQLEQEALGASFQQFIQNFVQQDVDYRIGVISTDVGDLGQLHSDLSDTPVITADLQSPTTLFQENVSVGVAGSFDEKAFEATALALGIFGPAAATDFLRDDAALFVIMVSDEDDASFGEVPYYARKLESLKGFGNNGLVSVSAIAGPPPDGCQSEKGAAAPGFRYLDLVRATGGVFTSICDDFAESLNRLSFSAVGLRDRFVLSQAADLKASVQECGDAGTVFGLCVTVNGEVVSEGFEYIDESQILVFDSDQLPPPGAEVVVKYSAAQ